MAWGYTVANVLWKESGEQDKAELLLIDLAPAEKEELIERYCSARKKGAPSALRLKKKLLD